MDLRDDRRAGDRRTSDRRHDRSQGGARRHERRTGARRRQIAGAGLLAAAAFAGVKSYSPQRQSFWDSLSSPTQSESTVDVQEDFRLPQYDKEALEPYIQEAAAMHGVSPDLVRAVVQTESQFNPLAVSPVGAQGLMQLMPNTAKHLGLDNPFDPRQNVIAGAKYLSLLLDRYKGNTALALAGYNAGPGNVKRYRGLPPFGETRGYVKKIQNLVAGSDAAFSIPVPPKPKVRRASLRAGKRAKVATLGRAASKRASLAKARTVRAAAKAKVARARRTTDRARAKTPASRSRARTARGRGTRA